MCGLIGAVNRHLDRTILKAIEHRGPDGDGWEMFEAGGRQIVLGHTRLSIQDLSSAGAQPMLSASGRTAIAFNGEIYNHIELRKRLPQHPWRGHSDTETIVELLERFGASVLADLNGIFAVACYFRDSDELVLARDPFGVKPLHYWSDGNSLIFSSELAALRMAVPLQIELPGLAELLRLRFVPAPGSLFSGVGKLRPGCAIRLRLGASLTTLQQVPFVSPHRESSTLQHDEAVEKFGELLDRAVDRQLLADVDVGVLLSGGIDSAIVAAHAQERRTSPIKAYTVGFKGESDVDEIESARRSAEYIGCEHHAVHIGDDDFHGSLGAAISVVGEPIATTSIIPMMALCERVGRDLKVVLSGQGADELLGGYRKHRVQAMLDSVPGWVARGLSAVARPLFPRSSSYRRLASVAQQGDIASRFLQSYEIFSEQQIAELLGVTEDRAMGSVEAALKSVEGVTGDTSAEKMMAVDSVFGLADDLLMYTDRISMRYGVECRVPMLDHELASFCRSLPGSMHLDWRSGKRLLRSHAAIKLPREVLARPKLGFESPAPQWLRADSVEERLLAPGTQFASYFDRTRVKALLEGHRRSEASTRQIFLLLSVWHWLEIVS